MKCSYCGCENVRGSLYCKNCGKYLLEQSRGPVEIPRHEDNTTKIVLITIISFVSVFLVAGMIGLAFMFGASDSGKISELTKSVDRFEELVDDTDCGINADAYRDLIEECRRIIDDNEEELADGKINEIDAKTEEIESLGGIDGEFQLLKDTYVQKFEMLETDAIDQSRISDLNLQSDQAKADKDINKKAELEEAYENLYNEILESNKSQVEALRYDIARIDITGAEEAEREELIRYNDKVSGALNEGNYREAIAELKGYQIYASSVASASAARSQEVQRQELSSQTQTVQSLNEYILPTSSSEYLTDADVKHLSRREAMLAKNEIFARHGRRFRDESIQQYFDGKSWYLGIYDPDSVEFNDLSAVEQANVLLLKKYE